MFAAVVVAAWGVAAGFVAGEHVVSLLEELDRLEEKANRVRVPASHANSVYTLRHHLSLVRERLREGRDR